MHLSRGPRSWSRSITVVLVLLASVVAACGDDSSSAEPADTTTTNPASTATSVGSTEPDLETALLQFLGNEDGGVSALVEQDSVVEVATVGVADSDGEPITADTSFYVGSISKVFTATLVMQLVDAGHVGLDDPLSDHLPDTTVGAGATIRSLLGHRSGIFELHREPQLLS